jgi:hypothetical protein
MLAVFTIDSIAEEIWIDQDLGVQSIDMLALLTPKDSLLTLVDLLDD